MSAPERRAQLIEHATELFGQRGYTATTTAQLASSAGVSEPVLYRHFANKGELYVACVDEAWTSVRDRLTALVEAEPDPARWMPTVTIAGRQFLHHDAGARLWMSALTEQSIDEAVRDSAARNLRDVHGFLTRLIRRAQAQGGVAADRDPRAEAWIFLSVAMLQVVTHRLSPLSKQDLDSLAGSRQRWLLG